MTAESGPHHKVDRSACCVTVQIVSMGPAWFRFLCFFHDIDLLLLQIYCVVTLVDILEATVQTASIHTVGRSTVKDIPQPRELYFVTASSLAESRA